MKKKLHEKLQGDFVLAFLAAFDVSDRVVLMVPGYTCYRHILQVFTDKNFKEVVKSSNEIMITGTKYFYANYSFFFSKIRLILDNM